MGYTRKCNKKNLPGNRILLGKFTILKFIKAFVEVIYGVTLQYRPVLSRAYCTLKNMTKSYLALWHSRHCYRVILVYKLLKIIFFNKNCFTVPPIFIISWKWDL